MADTTNPATSDNLRFRAKLVELRQNEKHWIWKASLRTIICVLDIIGIGAAAWLFAHRRSDQTSGLFYYGYSAWDFFTGIALVPLCISFVWCMLVIFVPFLLKPRRPLHPGIAVGIDLLLWLAFIVVAIFCLASVFRVVRYGTSASGLQEYHYSKNNSNLYYTGGYYVAPNNTLVFNITSINSYEQGYDENTGQLYDIPHSTTEIQRVCEDFNSCAEKDAYVNRLWREKSRKAALVTLNDAVLWLNVLLHFVVFVWACVDTNRYNLGKRARNEEMVTNKIMRDLEDRGLISMRDGVPVSQSGGAVREQPEMLQSQQQSQGHTLHTTPPQHAHTAHSQRGVANDHDEISPISR